MGPKDYVHPVTIGSRSDLAIVTLKKPVSGIVPIPLNRTAKSEDGTPGLIVGFGRTGGDNYDYGVKRTGEVKTGKCPNDNKYSANLVCWNYDAVIKAAGADSTHVMPTLVGVCLSAVKNCSWVLHPAGGNSTVLRGIAVTTPTSFLTSHGFRKCSATTSPRALAAIYQLLTSRST
jgi:hypothetical protein